MAITIPTMQCLTPTSNDQPLTDNRTVTVGLAASAEVEAQYTDLKMRSLIEDLLDPLRVINNLTALICLWSHM